MKHSILVPAALLFLAACTAPPSSGSATASKPERAQAREAVASGKSHAFGIDDMLAMDRLSDPQLSPDGQWILFNVRVTDLAANKGRTDLWKIAVGGGEPQRLTEHEATDTNGRWLADGSIVFLSSRSGSMQVWGMDASGENERQLSTLPLDVGNLAVFPDGKRLLLSFDVFVDAPDLATTAKRDAEREASPVKARVYDSLLFRHWDSWEDGKRSHVFAWTLGGGEPRDLMRGMDADAPTHPFGGTEELAISPDGKEVLFAAKDDGAANAWTTNIDVWRVPADGSAQPTRVSTGTGMDNVPSYSPDGSSIAWLSMERGGYEADRQRIVLLERASGKQRVLTQDWDRSAAEYCWSDDGKTLFAAADNVGNHSLFAVDVASGRVTTLVEKGTVASPLQAAGGLVYSLDTLRAPAELWSASLTGAGAKALTHFNDERVAAARMGEYEQFSFPGAHGDTVHGYLVKPADFDPAKKYPLAFLIHGGPQGSFGDHFHYRWNPQAYAGAGYAALMVDFHGSTGYGQAFCDAIREDWGGAPYEDLMKGLDFALLQYAFLDGNKVGALGASYGGYMINWIAGQTDRFECLVNHDGNLDERMAYFDTEELWFPEWDHGGLPWENPENYAKHNPIEFVKHWQTPMLVIHGGQDFRVVETQGMSTFTALQRLGIPSKFLYFPDENHWVLKPQNSRFWHQNVIGWLDQWLKGAQPVPAAAAR
ncbi:MAG: S9 family peptidase [Planctomycetes bacterium]|nr:S9 family peptidase [Planctomycetota bacterium]